MTTPTSDDARAVLQHFGVTVAGPFESLSGNGGFSGALFWRVEGPGDTWCARCWPSSHPTPERLARIHSYLAHAVQHGFPIALPLPLADADGHTFIRRAGRLWEVTRWLRGAANYKTEPTTEKLTAAMSMLGSFHRALRSLSRLGVSPGVGERLRHVRAQQRGGMEAIQAAATRCDDTFVRDAVRRWLDAAPLRLRGVEAALISVKDEETQLHPCIRDIWCDHVLFDHDRVVGVVDFGAMRIESPMGDVARLLNSLAAAHVEADWRTGLTAYFDSVGDSGARDMNLLRAFQVSQAPLALANWFHWLLVEGRQFEEMESVRGRIVENLTLLERE